MLICWAITPWVDKFNHSSPPFSTPPLTSTCLYSGAVAWLRVRRYRVIALLARALTPPALECGLLSPRSDQHLYSLSALGFNFGSGCFYKWTQSPVSPRILIASRRAGWGEFSGLPCHLGMEHKHDEAAAARVGWAAEVGQGFSLRLLAPAACTPSYLTKII